MNRWNWLIAVAVFFSTQTLGAQELPPPPPPPDLEEDSVEDDGTTSEDTAEPDGDDAAAEDPSDDAVQDPTPSSLAITAPLPGATIGTSTVVEGEAAPGTQVEVQVNGEIEKRLRVDQTGKFKVALSGLEPNARIKIAALEFDDSGEETNMVSVVARTGDPSAVIAAPADKPSEPPAVAEPEPLVQDRPEPAPEIEPTVPKPPMSQAARGVLEGLVGAIGGPVGGVMGLFAGGALAIVFANDNGDFDEVGYIVIGGLAGFAIGVPAGVYLTGYLLDGDGNLLLTILGSWAGSALGLLAFAALANTRTNSGEDLSFVGFALMCAMAGGGGALAFELTSNPSRRAAKQGISVAPTLAPSSDGRGVVLGFGGRF